MPPKKNKGSADDPEDDPVAAWQRSRGANRVTGTLSAELVNAYLSCLRPNESRAAVNPKAAGVPGGCTGGGPETLARDETAGASAGTSPCIDAPVGSGVSYFSPCVQSSGDVASNIGGTALPQTPAPVCSRSSSLDAAAFSSSLEAASSLHGGEEEAEEEEAPLEEGVGSETELPEITAGQPGWLDRDECPIYFLPGKGKPAPKRHSAPDGVNGKNRRGRSRSRRGSGR